ncbi:Clp N-terminal domain superfamily [Arabidopsis suecica]|uniref:Clp N-terminal domain superfamily n=1 Tax=Arabidopsis suecica TaxID=45249 RepID=A0A8T2CD15_ARASU|nr:Clp N-terminal domain superfamily [Arabidopsis suecica]
MPTPVTTARECLTEEAARALDDAVVVARRRSHAQTTSLHAVSALLAMPSSILREVCVSRAARSVPYSSRLQFRALELCVGVSLDRLPSSKSPATEEDPPVSNSLMAAIKRSQANQRRHPESYHLQQIHASNNGGGGCQTTVLKVELKYFILSILDDPIVNRVFGEAGFRSSEIKLDVLHPPVTQLSSRFSRGRCPPLFLCNLPNSDPNREFPFSGSSGFDENSRRIGEVLGRKDKKNPLLIGNCANEALKTFTDSINSGKLGFLPMDISGLSLISIEKEISEILADGSKNEEEIRMKVDDLGRTVEQSGSKSGIVLNLGELKVLTSEANAALEILVSKLSDLLKHESKQLSFIGCVSSNETYTKLIDRFPTIEKDWDLHVLPITASTKPSTQGVYPKSSLMGSFVPFGGFFSSTSNFRVPLSSTVNQTLSRCHLCNEKYLQEVAAVLKAGSSLSLADKCSEKLAPWLRAIETKEDKGITGSSKALDDANTSASQTAALQKKWDNICQSIHHTPAFPKLGFQSVSPQFPVQTEKSVRTPTSYLETPKLLNPPISKPKPMEDLTASVTNRTVSLPLSCVTTDFGLGVIYASKNQESKTTREKPMLVTLNSSLEHTYQKDFKSLREILSRKVAWQTEAVNAISQIICGCKTDSTRRNQASGIWLALLGPDKVGKKKVAMTLSEVFFGGKVNYICVDFGAEHCSLDDKFRGKTVVDYVTGELSRKPHSVVLLENVEKAEFPDQMRLSEAVSTGKIRDLHGRVISMKNVIVVVTSGIAKDNATDHVIKPVKFPEEQVLSARSWKLQIKLGDATKFGVNKRKYELETAQRAVKVQRSYLDLNLPVNETEFSLDHEAEDRDAWFDEFIEKVDGKVTFKPVDFDELAKNIQEKIGSHFERCFGSETHLELDKEVILQILAASWSSLSSGEEEGRTIVDQWMQTVLARSFAEAKQKYGSNPMLGVKLVASSSGLASGVELPAKVDVIW